MIQSITDLRNDAKQIFFSGIHAADPYLAVQQSLQFDGIQLICKLDLNNETLVRTKHWHKIYIVAFGKAACTMIKAVMDIIPAHLLAGQAIAVTNYENRQDIKHVEVIGAGHPLPDHAGLVAAQKITQQVQQAEKDDLVLVLVSGGGSALLPAPVAAIDLSEKIATTSLLLSSGATINEINCVRKHLSLIKGGGLAKMAAPADLHTLVLSDVVGDDLSAIASGPTVADNSTFSDALNVLNDRQLKDKVPVAVLEYLQKGQQAELSNNSLPDNSFFVQVNHTLVASNRISLQAIKLAAEKLNYVVCVYNEQLIGEAKKVAEDWVIYAKSLIKRGVIDHNLCAILAGGETTVIVNGTGKGGRNQEMTLAFAIAAERHQLMAEWTFLSAGTDGLDGPTDAAGGLVDSESLQRMLKAHIEPDHYLTNNDSYHALKKSEDLLITGATGTNVADLQILLIRSTHKIPQ